MLTSLREAKIAVLRQLLYSEYYANFCHADMENEPPRASNIKAVEAADRAEMAIYALVRRLKMEREMSKASLAVMQVANVLVAETEKNGNIIPEMRLEKRGPSYRDGVMFSAIFQGAADEIIGKAIDEAETEATGRI